MSSPYSSHQQEAVEALAQRLNALIEAGAKFQHQGKPVAKYVVRGHSWAFGNSPLSWGLVPRWTYPDRPDLGEFGGEFMVYRDAHSLCEQYEKENANG